MQITLKPVELRAFSERDGYWTKYDSVARDGITSMTVEPVIKSFSIDGHLYVELDACFDEGKFPEEKYGLVYGDGAFEEAMNEHLRKVFGLPEDMHVVSYTEQGMQSPGVISMEIARAARPMLTEASNHERLRLASNPLVAEVHF